MTARDDRALAVAVGVTSFAWYAMPDAVRSRGVRTLLKTALLAKLGVFYALTNRPRPESNGPDATDELFHAANQAPGRALAVGLAAVGTGVGLTVLGEKAVFGFGERRRRRGVRGAHTVPALVLAALGGLGVLLEPPPRR